MNKKNHVTAYHCFCGFSPFFSFYEFIFLIFLWHLQSQFSSFEITWCKCLLFELCVCVACDYFLVLYLDGWLHCAFHDLDMYLIQLICFLASFHISPINVSFGCFMFAFQYFYFGVFKTLPALCIQWPALLFVRTGFDNGNLHAVYYITLTMEGFWVYHHLKLNMLYAFN